MKKFIAFLTAMVLLLALTACGNEKAEKYCWNCGEGIAKNVSFCSNCGAEQEVPDASNTSTISKTTEEQKTTVTQEPVATTKKTATNKPVHTHSYSKKTVAATCTEKGYTIYTCSCGHTYKDNYTNPAHNFSKYKCTKCGTVDKAHAYDYLLDFVMRNGKVDGEQVSIYEYDESWQYGISYSAAGDFLRVTAAWYHSDPSKDFYVLIDLSSKDKNFNYASFAGSPTNRSAEGYGKINGKTYTENSPVTCDEYYGNSSTRNDFLEKTRLFANVAIEFLKDYINQRIPGIDITDIGFANF